MGTHARARRAPAGRAAMAATLVAVAAVVLVGVGVAHQSTPSKAAASEPLLPVAAAPLAAAPLAAVPAVAPESASPTTAPEATEEAEPAVTEQDTPEPAAEETAPPVASPRAVPARTTPETPALVAGTPCTATASACVDLVGRNAWLIDDGAVTRGPVKVMTGDQDDPTPRGTFKVQWKAEQYTSREYLTQMPYSVFFADGGIAFHEGRQDTFSAGCVKLVHDDAVAWFSALQTGDEVQVR